MFNVSGRITLLTLAGIAAGLLTWLLSDLSGIIRLPDVGAYTAEVLAQYPNAVRDQTTVGVFFGAMVGLMLGLADMIASGMGAQWKRIIGYGVLIGAIAGFVGLSFGGVVFGWLYSDGVTNPLRFLFNTLARAAGWGFIGALAGSADGIRKWSGRTVRNGVIGGFIGGVLGGTVFEAAIYLFAWVPRPAVVSRLLGFVITGALIGLFIGLVQQLLKEAWVRIVVGKNEGREVLLDKTQSTIGRSELSDIALFGDMSVQKNHAVVIASPSGGYVLRDLAEKSGTVKVNGNTVPKGEEVPVRSGDTILVGGKTLLFFERLTKERTASVRDGRTVSPVPAALMGLSAGSAVPSPPAPFSTAPATATTPGKMLVATSGPHIGQSFAARSGAIIGRDAAVEIALPNDASASRRHARIVQEALSLAIEDTGSTNGTFVNGQRITRQSLVPGDIVLVGTSELRLE